MDIFVSYEDFSEGQVALKYNSALAAEYLSYMKQMEDEFGLRMIFGYLRFPLSGSAYDGRAGWLMKTSSGMG